MTFAKATENECIDDRHCQRTHAIYISAKSDNSCSVVSVRKPSYLSIVLLFTDVINIVIIKTNNDNMIVLFFYFFIVLNSAVFCVLCAFTELHCCQQYASIDQCF